MARASTRRSMSRPLRTRSSGVSRWLMRSTSCSMIGPSSRSRGDVMRGGADQLDAALVRLVVGPRPLEARQERMMDVDAAARQLRRQLIRQDLHVARQHHKVGCVSTTRSQTRASCSRLVSGHRQIVERNLAEIEIAVVSRGWLETMAVGIHRAVRRCASDRGYPRGNGRISRPAASPGGG